MAREGFMLVSGSVSIGGTYPPTQGDLPGLPSLMPPWRHSPHPICFPRACSAGLQLSAAFHHSRTDSLLHPALLCNPTPSLPHLSENVGRGGGHAQVHPRHEAGAHSPTPLLLRKRLPAECRLLLSKPNFLAGLQESQGTPSLCRAGGKDLSWFLLIGLIYSAVQM